MKDTISDILCKAFPDRDKRDLTSNNFDETWVAQLLERSPKRLQHVWGVKRLAEYLFSTMLSPELLKKLTTAALFHDIGYAEELNLTGFHPLDGAVFLAHHGIDDDIVKAVLYHTCASEEASYFDSAKGVYRSLPLYKADKIDDALTYCDLRTSPTGETVTPDERYAEIFERYGESHHVSENIRNMKPEFDNITRRVLNRVNNKFEDTYPWMFLDIDNTLIAPGHRISEVNYEAIRSYCRAGGNISLATGKHPLAIFSLVKHLGLTTPQISGNGAVIISENRLEPAEDVIGTDGIKVYNVLLKEKIPHAIYAVENIYVHPECITDEHQQILIAIDEPKPVKVPVPDWRSVFKILVFVSVCDASLEKYLKTLALNEGLLSVRTSSTFVEIMSPSTSKANAMKVILDRFQWPPLHTAALGDSENDLSILRSVGLPAVVGNASAAAIKAVPFQVANCDSDGAAEFISLLIKKKL